MDSNNIIEYKKYVTEKLNGLRQVFAKAAVGDYSEILTIPDSDDEFTELYAGIQIMLEVIRSKIKELEDTNKNLEQKLNDLELLNKITVNRELKLINLKKKVETLMNQIRLLENNKNLHKDHNKTPK